MTRILVYLTEAELQTLQQSAEREMREPREQARWLIIRSLAADLATEASQPLKLSQPTTGAERVQC